MTTGKDIKNMSNAEIADHVRKLNAVSAQADGAEVRQIVDRYVEMVRSNGTALSVITHIDDDNRAFEVVYELLDVSWQFPCRSLDETTEQQDYWWDALEDALPVVRAEMVRIIEAAL